MILEFSVENFRSIADRQTLSFVASKHKSEASGEAAVEEPGFAAGKLLTSVVLYGANASGKSNILFAMNHMMWRISESATRGEMLFEPFRLDPAWSNKPTRFELSFVKEGVRYQYGFAFDRERVVDEWLVAYPKLAPQLWFQRGRGVEKVDIHFGPHLRGEKTRLATMTRPDALFLSVAAQFNNAQLSDLHKWLLRHVTARQSYAMGPLQTARLVEKDGPTKDGVCHLLQGADLGITGVTVRRHANVPEPASGTKAVLGTEKTDEYVEILMEHRGADGVSIRFDLFAEESHGTGRFFELVAPVTAALRRGSLLAVDELDQSLHPLLVRKIVSLFHDPKANPRHAQLLFNTHDTTLLDPKLFRRDQIWFVEKDAAGKSRLYSLLDYSPRKEEALQRGYLQGRYGAIPFLDNLRFPVTPPEDRRAG